MSKSTTTGGGEAITSVLRDAREWVEAEIAPLRGVSPNVCAPGDAMLKRIDAALAAQPAPVREGVEPEPCFEISRKRLAEIDAAWDQHTALDEADISFLLRMARQRLYDCAAPPVPEPVAPPAGEEIDVIGQKAREMCAEFCNEALYSLGRSFPCATCTADEHGRGWRADAEEALSKIAQPAAQGEPVAWRSMNTAPRDGKTKIVARHKPNEHTPHGWIATITIDPDDGEYRRGGLDTICHYNGDALMTGFHGVWTGWLYPHELASLSPAPQPAAQGEAAAGGSGDLAALSAGEDAIDRLTELNKAATPGAWYVVDTPWGNGDWISAGSADPHAGKAVCNFDFLDEDREDGGPTPQDDAAFVATLVTVYRSGLLTRASFAEHYLERTLDLAKEVRELKAASAEASAPTPDLGAQGEPVAWEKARELQRRLEQRGAIQFKPGAAYGYITEDGVRFIADWLASSTSPPQPAATGRPSVEEVAWPVRTVDGAEDLPTSEALAEKGIGALADSTRQAIELEADSIINIFSAGPPPVLRQSIIAALFRAEIRRIDAVRAGRLVADHGDLYHRLMALRLQAAEFADEAADNTSGPTSTFEAKERGRASAFSEAANMVKALLAADRGDGTRAAGEMQALYDKLDGDSLDAICEVIGSPRLYNDGKSAMRQWFLGRLRRAWGIAEPAPVETNGTGGGR